METATTSHARVQVVPDASERVREGMLVEVRAWRGKYRALARIERLRCSSTVLREGLAVDTLNKLGVNLRDVADATTYITADVEILGLTGKPGLPPLPRPPLPGDEVHLLPEDPEKVFGVKLGSRGVVWYGSLYGYDNLPVPLNVENLTMHIGVFGETGSGKSYGVGYLLELLSRIPAGDGKTVTLPAIVVDANGDYLDYIEAYVKYGRAAGYPRVYRFVSPKAYEERFRTSLEAKIGVTLPLRITMQVFTLREVAEMLILYKTGGREVNELQVSILERALEKLVEDGYNVDDLLSRSRDVLLETLEGLGRDRESGFNVQTARAAKAAVAKFSQDVERFGLLGDATLDKRFLLRVTGGEPSLVIVDFSADGFPGAPLSLKQLVISYIARLLYSTFTELKVRGDERYVMLVIEEAQNYAPNLRNYPIGISVARDYLALLATQGRKFGISLLVVTQRPAFLDPVVLSMLNTMIIHRVAPDDVTYVLRAIGGLPQEMANMLTRLPRGVALLVGQLNMLGHPLLVRVGRRTVEHRMGRTALVETLAKLQGGGVAGGDVRER